ncbi:NlpC/P60 family protein [Streptomyces sp. NPDC056479]|uniref:C40 family peptidase n=1 Tax=Streptomyces sp. NPDC056479 TaxID=3345832 RepID=UPI0036B6DFCB
MAPEGTARPGALSLPGMRNSALASAALTSVALLGQTAGATPSAADETPSREEVGRRISSLYDRAETDSGTFNATRAASTGPRKRAARPADFGSSPAAAPRAGESRGGDPALDSVTRQWFDVARAKLGPTVPAVLPSDRTPDRPAPQRPPRELDGPDRARDSSGRPALELTAGPAAESTSARAIGAAPLAELTAGPIAALPPAPPAPGADLQATQVIPPVLALPAGNAPDTAWDTAPAAEPQQRSALRTTKEQNQRKLDRARQLLSTYLARQNDPLTAPLVLPAADNWSATPDPIQPSPEAQWQALQAQSAADLTTVPPGATAWPAAAPAPIADVLALPVTDQTLGAYPALTSTGPQDTRSIRALEFARAQLGKPCVSGTTGPEAYDGPGLTQAAWKAAGISLPRTAQEQAIAGQGVALTRLEPGDLVLFHAGHVGIYSGNGMMIHAPGPGAIIREESIHYAGEAAIHSAIRPA